MAETARQKLNIKEVQEVKTMSKGGQVLAFTSDKGERWAAFNAKLFPYIKAGITIDADTEIKDVERDGKTYINRSILNIYVDDKAVLETGKAAPYAKPPYSKAKTDEERASIEAQTAIKAIAGLWQTGQLTEDSPDVKEMRTWCRSKIAVPSLIKQIKEAT